MDNHTRIGWFIEKNGLKLHGYGKDYKLSREGIFVDGNYLTTTEDIE